jgi:hypothetical protein
MRKSRRIIAGAGISALLALGVFGIHELGAQTNRSSLSEATFDEPSAPKAATNDRPDDNVTGDARSSSNEPAMASTDDDSDADDDSFEDDDEELDPAEQRLSAEIRLLENRRRARDRLLAVPSDRLSPTDRALLEVRRASLSEKLALQAERVDRLSQRVGSVEAGYEAQNGNP